MRQSANTRWMHKFALFSVLMATSTLGYAQSKVDRVPQPAPDSPIPLAPPPSDDIRDLPPIRHAQSGIVQQFPEPNSKLLIAGPLTDTVSHHFFAVGGVGYASPAGSVDSQTPLRSRVSAGPAFVLGIGYGVSRNIDIELNGAYTAYVNTTECPDCSAKMYDAIGAIRYHLVQGVRFDPWLCTGVGVSIVELKELRDSREYAGLRWFDLSIGGDWYATRNFGFGPFLGIALSTYLNHPTGGTSSVSAKLALGINLSFDTTGK